MRQITIYRNKDCSKCARIARVHKLFDWLGRLEISIDTPKTGLLQPGEIAVEDRRTGETVKGVEAVRRICRQIPVYMPLLLLLKIPAVARRVDSEAGGCTDGSCAVPQERG